ncbi:elastin-like [Agrilus planipennis]|uniref:Elastin-like n=1 Tax=Agrilus planipennis TaxID=224129 RepID=A0A7F5R931_AGRPL|nr:elastin-like [Agrilus planipennis]
MHSAVFAIFTAQLIAQSFATALIGGPAVGLPPCPSVVGAGPGVISAETTTINGLGGLAGFGLGGLGFAGPGLVSTEFTSAFPGFGNLGLAGLGLGAAPGVVSTEFTSAYPGYAGLGLGSVCPGINAYPFGLGGAVTSSEVTTSNVFGGLTSVGVTGPVAGSLGLGGVYGYL